MGIAFINTKNVEMKPDDGFVRYQSFRFFYYISNTQDKNSVLSTFHTIGDILLCI